MNKLTDEEISKAMAKLPDFDAYPHGEYLVPMFPPNNDGLSDPWYARYKETRLLFVKDLTMKKWVLKDSNY